MSTSKEKIVIGADHGGLELKEAVKKYLLERGDIDVLDIGTYTAESVDYPLYGVKVGKAVAKGEADRGIVVCGTGIGITIAANKVKGIRAANCVTPVMAEMSRKHNNANVLGLGGRILDTATALEITRLWLETPYEGGRHQQRLEIISATEA
jgi:ribose 5-phosphate isomerase B